MEDKNVTNEKLQQKYNIICEQVAQAPKSARLYGRLGDVCLELGHRKEALVRYKKAVELDPGLDDVVQRVKKNFSEDELRDISFPAGGRPFWQNLNAVIRYPFARQGIVIIVAGALLFAILDILIAIPILGFFFAIVQFFLVFPYILAYMLKIINTAAMGGNQLPDWPEFSDWWESVYRPAIQVIFAVAVSLSPVIFVFMISLLGFAQILVLLPLALILGIIYYPMALIAVALFDNIWMPLNVSLLLGSIWKIKGHYLLALVTVGIFIVIEYVIIGLIMLGTIPLLGPFINWTVTLYFLAVQMYILGNVYHVNKHILRWT